MDTITEDSDEGRASAKFIDPLASLQETPKPVDRSINSDEEAEESKLTTQKSKSDTNKTTNTGVSVSAGITKEGDRTAKTEKKRVSFSPEEMVHPNEEGQSTVSTFLDEVKPGQRNCAYYLKKLDYDILRPLLIKDYQREQMHRQDDFVEMMINDGNILGNVYGQLDFEYTESITEEVILDRVAKAVTKVAGEITVRQGYQSFSQIDEEVRDRASTMKDHNR